jgi:hypothetical protein
MRLSLRQRFALFRFKRKARKKNCVGWRVSDVPGLLKKLEQNGIPAVVLRWFDEVPVTQEQETQFSQDVDLLIDGAGLDLAVALASQQPGPVRCDVYTDVGMRGSTYSGMPYYPPVSAQELLQERLPYRSAFFVPNPKLHFRSLVYHLVYHKGLESGIPSGCHLMPTASPKRPYERLLLEMAAQIGVELERPVTLWGLHRMLKQDGWDMPLDLIARWPRQTAWHEWLLAKEREDLWPWVEVLPHLMVFFVREDATQRGLTQAARRMLSEKFAILATKELSDDEIGRVMRQVRGGDWVHNRKSTTIRPKTAVICYDFAPMPAGSAHSARNARSNKPAYRFIDNDNVFVKHEIRERLGKMAGQTRRLQALHGSDNPYEAQHMLQAIYGDDTPQMNRRFLASLPQLRPTAPPRRAA